MANMSVEQAFSTAVQNHQAGRPTEAENIYRQIIAQQPGHADAHYMLAVLGHEMGRGRDAIPFARRAVELNPANPDFHILLGVLFATTANNAPAIESFQRAVGLRPNDPAALNNLGNALRQGGRAEEAVAAYRKVLDFQPDFPEAYANMSTALVDLGQYDQAIDACRKAITLRPGYAGAYNDLGNALKHNGQFEEAMQAYSQALAFQPNNAEASYNLGNVYKEKGNLDEALGAYRQAIALRPDFSSAQWNLSLTLLLKGDFAAGWEAYEARWNLPGNRRDRGFTQPMWDGSNLAGRRILLHTEQGLGDTIQFVRYAPLVKARGGHVSLLCPPELQRLFADQLGFEHVVGDDAAVPEFDVHCPLMSLPLVLGASQKIPAEVPYLAADSAISERWRRRLADQPAGLKVGLVWSGRPENVSHKRTAMKLQQLAPLAKVAGIQLYSLQKGNAAVEAKAPPYPMQLTDWTGELNDFADTAALVQNLDLVISVDTAVAHLAGALARPVWLLLPFSPDWRWMLNRSDSPWYPTMRIFRQPKFSDWESVIQQVSEALTAEVTKR